MILCFGHTLIYRNAVIIHEVIDSRFIVDVLTPTDYFSRSIQRLLSDEFRDWFGFFGDKLNEGQDFKVGS